MRLSIFFVFGAVFCAMFGSAGIASADIMNVNVSGVDPAFRSAFLAAEAFWEKRLIAYSPALPAAVRAQLTKLQITAVTNPIDGVGGVLGAAGPTNVVRYNGGTFGPKRVTARPIAVAKASQMTFDSADMQDLANQGALIDVIRHEMAHALGLGSLWADNALLATVNGAQQYIGAYGLARYRTESGNLFSPFVPVEQRGGGGTAGAHWDGLDPFFSQTNQNRSELMVGFLDNTGEGLFDTKFVSETTWAQFADLWFVVKGINDGGFRDVVPPYPPSGKRKWYGGPPLYMRVGAVPEPSGIAILGAFGLIGTCLRRRRI